MAKTRLPQPGDITEASRLIGEHVRAMRGRVDRVKTELARLGSDVRSRLLDAKWVTGVMQAVSVKSPANTTTSANTPLTMRASIVRGCPLVANNIASAETALYEGAVAIVDAMQRNEYRMDHETRGRIYNAVTNPGVEIQVTVSEDELGRLAGIPLEGSDRNDLLGRCATEFSDGLRAATVRIVAATKGGAEQSASNLALAVDRAFDGWWKRVSRVSALAANVAMQASAKVFLSGLVLPAKRSGVAKVM